MAPKRILLVSHLSSVRSFVAAAFRGNKDATVVATAANLMQAYSDTETLRPDAAIVSYEFAEIAEFEMLAALFTALDVRWVFVTTKTHPGNAAPSTGFNSAGVFPVDISDPPQTLVRQLQTLIVSQSSVGPARPSVSTKGFDPKTLVLIGSSTGGVEALSSLLSTYPENCPPTCIVQHTGESFGASFVRLLQSRSKATVVPAQQGLEIRAGMICIAAGQKTHMSIGRRHPYTVELQAGAPVSGHIPSVDVLFSSATRHAANTVACLMTGMGSDGAKGLLQLRQAGARTFAQDEKTSVVYGMPRVAWEIGAAEKRVPLTQICKTILDTCQEIAPRTRATH